MPILVPETFLFKSLLFKVRYSRNYSAESEEL